MIHQFEVMLLCVWEWWECSSSDSCELAVPLLGRGHVAAEWSSNSAVRSHHIRGLRIVKQKISLWGMMPCILVEIAFFRSILWVEQYLKMEAVIYCETSVDFRQICASHIWRQQLITVFMKISWNLEVWMCWISSYVRWIILKMIYDINPSL
jgi:hypothetical protein